MSLGQTAITAAFLVLLIMIVINANRLLLGSAEATYESQAIEIATDAVQQLIVEATSKKFDTVVPYYEKKKKDSYLRSTSEFTASSSLGPDAGEAFTLPDTGNYKSLTTYDDLDDYNNYTRIYNGSEITGFVITSTVYYVTAPTSAPPLAQTTSKSGYKRVNVNVSHPLYLNGITFNRITAY